MENIPGDISEIVKTNVLGFEEGAAVENHVQKMLAVHSIQMRLESVDFPVGPVGAYQDTNWQCIEESSPSPEQVLYFIRQACPDFAVEIEETIGEGDRVMVLWRLRGTDTRGFQGRVPTGKQVHMTGVQVVNCNEDGISLEWEAADLLGVLLQLGFICLPQQPRITLRRRSSDSI